LCAKNVSSLGAEFPALQTLKPKQFIFPNLFIRSFFLSWAGLFSRTRFFFGLFQIRSAVLSTDPLGSKKRGQQCCSQP
jgi:hypothetical protein